MSPTIADSVHPSADNGVVKQPTSKTQKSGRVDGVSSTTSTTPKDSSQLKAEEAYEPYLFPEIEKDRSWAALPYRIFRFLLLMILVIVTVIAPNVCFLFCRVIQLFNMNAGKKAASFCVGWSCWIYWTFFTELGVEFEMYGDEIGLHENAIAISNHVSSMDFILVLSMALRGGMLGNVKYFAKNSISYIPFVGGGMKTLDMVFLKRDWMKDEKHIKSTFRSLRESHTPVWIVSFLEGTRITKEKSIDSIKFQLERNMPVTTQVMAPRIKGFISTLQGLPELEYVYDFTFAYVSGVYSITDWLFYPYPKNTRLCIHVNKIPVKDIPRHDEEALKEWAYDLFVKKDKLLRSMYKGKDGIYRFPQKKRPSPFIAPNWWTVPFEKSDEKLNQEKKQ